MNAKPIAVYVAVALAFGAGVNTTVSADDRQWGRQDSACRASARTMHRACHLDAGDDYLTTLANCAHEPTYAARTECKAAARAALVEGRGECRGQFSARADVCEVLGENRYADPIVNPQIEFVDPDDVGSAYPPNPYVSVVDKA